MSKDRMGAYMKFVCESVALNYSMMGNKGCDFKRFSRLSEYQYGDHKSQLITRKIVKQDIKAVAKLIGMRQVIPVPDCGFDNMSPGLIPFHKITEGCVAIKSSMSMYLTDAARYRLLSAFGLSTHTLGELYEIACKVPKSSYENGARIQKIEEFSKYIYTTTK